MTTTKILAGAAALLVLSGCSLPGQAPVYRPSATATSQATAPATVDPTTPGSTDPLDVTFGEVPTAAVRGLDVDDIAGATDLSEGVREALRLLARDALAPGLLGKGEVSASEVEFVKAYLTPKAQGALDAAVAQAGASGDPLGQVSGLVAYGVDTPQGWTVGAGGVNPVTGVAVDRDAVFARVQDGALVVSARAVVAVRMVGVDGSTKLGSLVLSRTFWMVPSNGAIANGRPVHWLVDSWVGEQELLPS